MFDRETLGINLNNQTTQLDTISQHLIIHLSFKTGSLIFLADVPYDYDATGMKCYLAACEKVGVIPVSHFLRNLTEPIVSLKYHGLGAMGAYALSRALIVSFSICF